MDITGFEQTKPKHLKLMFLQVRIIVLRRKYEFLISYKVNQLMVAWGKLAKPPTE